MPSQASQCRGCGWDADGGLGRVFKVDWGEVGVARGYGDASAGPACCLLRLRNVAADGNGIVRVH